MANHRAKSKNSDHKVNNKKIWGILFYNHSPSIKQTHETNIVLLTEREARTVTKEEPHTDKIMSPKKDKSLAANGGNKEIPGIFSDIKIDVNALDGNYAKSISGDSYRPYTIFGNGELG